MIIQTEQGIKLEVPNGSTPGQIDEIMRHASGLQAKESIGQPDTGGESLSPQNLNQSGKNQGPSLPEMIRSKFSDQPDTYYGNILPLARNEKTGETSLAFPEMIRSPMRGIADLMAATHGDVAPATDNPLEGSNLNLSPDALGALAMLSPTSVANKSNFAMTNGEPKRPPIGNRILDKIGQESQYGNMEDRAFNSLLPSKAPPKVERIVTKQLENALGRDGVDLNDLPLNQTLLSNAGRGTINRAESIVTRDNPGAEAILSYIEKQKSELPQDLSGAIGEKFPEGNYPSLLEYVKNKAQAVARPAYEKAYNELQNINDPQINATLDRVASAGDWGTLVSEARKIAAYEGHTLGKLDRDTGAIIDFSTKDLDYMTRALRNLGQGTEGAGAFGGKTYLGSLRQKNAMDIRNRLGELNPAFKEATSNFADSVAIKDAAEAGKAANLFGSSWKQAVKDYSTMSEDAKTAWRIGQAENLQTQIANNPQATLRRFNTPQFQKVMSNFYTPQEIEKLTAYLSSKANEISGYQRVVGNSRSAARIIQQADDAAMLNDGPRKALIETIRRGPYGAAKKGVSEFVENKLFNTPTQQQADTTLAQLLTSTPFDLAARENLYTNDTARNALMQLLMKKEK